MVSHPSPSSQRMQNSLPEELALCLALTAQRKSASCMLSQDTDEEESAPSPQKQLGGFLSGACSSMSSSGPQWPAATPPPPCLSFPEFFPESVELSQANTSFQRRRIKCVWAGGREHPKEVCTRTKGQKAKNLRLSHTSHHASGDEAQYLPCRHEDLSGYPELRKEPSIVEISLQSPHWRGDRRFSGAHKPVSLILQPQTPATDTVSKYTVDGSRGMTA